METFRNFIIPMALSDSFLQERKVDLSGDLSNIHVVLDNDETAQVLFDIDNELGMHQSGAWSCSEPKMAVELGKFKLLAQSQGLELKILAAENFTFKSRSSFSGDGIEPQPACSQRCCPQINRLAKSSGKYTDYFREQRFILFIRRRRLRRLTFCSISKKDQMIGSYRFGAVMEDPNFMFGKDGAMITSYPEKNAAIHRSQSQF